MGTKEEARRLAEDIHAFDRQCSREEYTDTDRAWELLTKARRLLAEIGKSAAPPKPATFRPVKAALRFVRKLPRVPASYPVQPLKPGDPAKDRAECGTCGRAWDDGKITGITPTPSGRCPFESFH